MSGLPVTVVAIERDGGEELAAREHPRLVRLTHWANAAIVTVMTMSGLQIFVAFPSFGPKIPQSDFLTVPEIFRLGGWLGGALQWHFAFAWLFTLTGIVYVAYLAVSGHWRLEAYNPLQRLAYTFTILCGVLAVGTGLLLARPVQFSAIVEPLGGFSAIRIYHFAAMVGFLAFIPGHLVMVALHGWNNFASMWTGWKKRPDYLLSRAYSCRAAIRIGRSGSASFQSRKNSS